MKIFFLSALLFTTFSLPANHNLKLSSSLPDYEFIPYHSLNFPKKNRLAFENDASKLVLKMNIWQLVFKNFSFQGEYAFHKKLSLALGFSYLMPRNGPKILFSRLYPAFSAPRYGGFTLTPEFRFYPMARTGRPAPNGFYIAGYLRYAKYLLQQNYTGEKIQGQIELRYSGMNVGLMLGKQWIIGKHFSLDWWIVGAGYGLASARFKFTSDQINLSEAEQQLLKEQTYQYWDKWSFLGSNIFNLQSTNNSMAVVATGLPMYSLRLMGLCLGYAF